MNIGILNCFKIKYPVQSEKTLMTWTYIIRSLLIWNNIGPLMSAVTDALALHYCTVYNYFWHTQMSKVRTMSWYSFNSIDDACSSAVYYELLRAFIRCQSTLFMAYQASNRRQRNVLQLIKPLICLTPTNHRPSWSQFIQLGEQITSGWEY